MSVRIRWFLHKTGCDLVFMICPSHDTGIEAVLERSDCQSDTALEMNSQKIGSIFAELSSPVQIKDSSARKKGARERGLLS